MDILDDKIEDGEVDHINVEAVKKNDIGLKEKAFDVTETSLKRDFKNYETEFEADLRKRSQDSIIKEDLNTTSNDHTKETIIRNVTLGRADNSNTSSTHTNSSTNGQSQSHSSNQLEHISNLEIDHKLNFTKINQTKVKREDRPVLFFLISFNNDVSLRPTAWRKCRPCTSPARLLMCLTASRLKVTSTSAQSTALSQITSNSSSNTSGETMSGRESCL